MEKNISTDFLEALMKGCPDILTIKEAVSWSPFGKNQIYKLIKDKQLRAYYINGSYMVAKSELIDYLLKHRDEASHLHILARKCGGAQDD